MEKGSTIQILLCELKSKFAIGEINKAMHQLVGSYMKLQAQLSILKSFRDKTIEIKGLIASFSPKLKSCRLFKNEKTSAISKMNFAMRWLQKRNTR